MLAKTSLAKPKRRTRLDRKVLETQRLSLEPLEPKHAAALYPCLTDPRIYRFIPQEPPLSLDALEKNYRSRCRGGSPDGKDIWLNWAMRLRDQGPYIGLLEATVHPDHSADIAYFVFPDFGRKDYAKEGCRKMIECLFAEFGVAQIAATMDTRNEASVRLAESLGFSRVSIQKGADFFKGESSDEYRYELARS